MGILYMLTELGLIALAVASISMTITESKLFAPLWGKLRDGWFKKLMSCGYCISHYVATVIVIVYRPTALSVIETPGFNYIVVVFAVITLSAFCTGLIKKAYQ